MLSPRRRRCARQLSVAAAAGLATYGVAGRVAHAQQNPDDQTVFLNASDGPAVSSFYNGSNFQMSTSAFVPAGDAPTNATVLPAGTAPRAGYAYVVTGSSAGTGILNATGSGTFAGDSLTVLAFDGQANLNNTSSYGTTNGLDTSAALVFQGSSNTAITVRNLVLGNGGAVIADVDSQSSAPTATLAGTIDLLAAGTTLDGVTTTTSGGIIDVNNSGGFTVSSTLVGAGTLRLVSSVRGTQSRSTVTLAGTAGVNADGSSNFSGGVTIDSTVSRSASGSLLYVNIASATTLGSGTLTLQSVNPTSGAQVTNLPKFDNTTGGTLSLANAQQWNGGFAFTGTNSIYDTGVATMGYDAAVTVSANVLAVGGINTRGHALTINGNTPGAGALEVASLSNISGGGTVTVGVGGTLAFPAANNSAAALAGYAGTLNGNKAFSSNQYGDTGLFGIDTTNVSGGTFNMTSGLPGGTYGLNKLGSGTLRLLAANSFTGPAVLSGGTTQLGVANALDTAEYVAFGGPYTPAGTLDLNGFSPSHLDPVYGGNGGVLTNANASSTSTFTIQPPTNPNAPRPSFGGRITGNLAVVVNYPAPSSNTDAEPSFNNTTVTNTYTGGTTLVSGVLIVASTAGLPLDGKTVFAGGALELSAQYGGEDVSAAFSQQANQQYDIGIEQSAAVNVFRTGLNSQGGSLTLGILNTDGTVHSGSGTLVLAGSNGYTGPTTVNSGTLQIANASGLAGTSSVTVPSYTPIAIGGLPQAGTLSINDSSGSVGLVNGSPTTAYISGFGSTITYVDVQILGQSPHLMAVGYTQYGALQGVPGGNAVWAGNVVIGAAGDAGAGISGGFNGSTGGTLTLTGAITGTGPLQLGLNPGTTTTLANGNNAYTGETQVNCSTGAATTVQLGANNAIPAASGLNFTFNNAYTTGGNPGNYNLSAGFGTQTFDLNRYSTAVAYLKNYNFYALTNLQNAQETTGSTVPATIVNTAAGTTSTLTIAGNGTSAYTFSGNLVETAASGRLAVVMNAAGGGRQAFTGASNYSGGTTITAGTLQANAAQVLSGTTLLTSSTGVGTVVVSGAGVLAGTGGTGPVIVNAGGTITAGTGATAGDTVGTLATAAEAWNASGGYVAKVASTSSVDKLVMSGLAINASSASPFTVTALGSGTTIALGQRLLVATDTGATTAAANPFTATIASGALAIGSSSTLSVPSGDALALATKFDAGGYELYVTAVTAAPEPTSLALAGMAAGTLVAGRGRRRHRRS